MRDNKNHNGQSHLFFNRNSSYTMAQTFVPFSKNCEVNCFIFSLYIVNCFVPHILEYRQIIENFLKFLERM